jgi:hypothetical protein
VLGTANVVHNILCTTPTNCAVQEALGALILFNLQYAVHTSCVTRDGRLYSDFNPNFRHHYHVQGIPTSYIAVIQSKRYPIPGTTMPDGRCHIYRRIPLELCLMPPFGPAITACALQSCLSKNTYNQERCDDHLRKLYLCCQGMYVGRKGDSESTACPNANVVQRWLKDHPKNS